jgi:hypothetical protein
MQKVKTGLRGKNAEAKLKMIEKISQGMKSSTVFAKERSLLRELERTSNSLSKSIEMASYGDRRAIGARKLCEKQAENLIRRAALKVEELSSGDEKLIKAVGFETRKRNNKPAQLEAPEGLEIKSTETEGSILLKWRPVQNSKSYLVQTSTTGKELDSDWTAAGFTTRSRHLLTDLKPGKTMWFRVRAIGAKGIGPPSIIVAKRII